LHVKTISGVDYHLYEDEQEFRKHHKKEELKDDWRKAQEGEWAVSDDGQVFSVLRRAVMYSNQYKQDTDYIRTLLGTVFVVDGVKLSGEPAEDIYTFTKYKASKYISAREKLFAKMVAMGRDATDAYLTVYKTKNRRYAINRSRVLLRQKRIRTLINKEVEELMDDLGITKTYLLENAKLVVDKSDARDGDRLRALETLMKISGLLTTDKKSESIALIQEFTGFTKDKLKAFESGLIEENASQ
jgi:hypothetical protein|tara:strand:+ start:115 stop:843 length:729 start_codon:yes stop_codon:yes gene_type:complete